MKVMAAQSNLCLYGPKGRVRAESTAVELRRVGLLPKGGRGAHAPDITPAEAAVFALVLASTETVARSAETAVALRQIHNRQGETLIAAIGRQMAGQCARNVLCVRILPDRDALPCAAEIWLRAGEGEAIVEHFARPDLWEAPGFSPYAIGAGYVGPVGHIGGGVLSQFKIDFAGPCESGWANPEEGELVSE